MIVELKNIQTDNKSIRDFGLLIGCILLIIAGFSFYKGRDYNLPLISLGFSFIGLGLENSSSYTGTVAHNPLILMWLENGILGLIGFSMIYMIMLLLFSGLQSTFLVLNVLLLLTLFQYKQSFRY